MKRVVCMLRFENQEEITKQATPLPPTEEETARALNALDKQASEHGHRAALKATLEELGSTVTEEEILAEVARQREEAKLKQKAETLLREQRQRKRKRLAIIAAIAFLPLVYFITLIAGTINGNRQRAAVEEAGRIAAIRQELPRKWSLSPNTLALTRTTSGSQIRTLAEIPDGEMVEVSFADFIPAGDRESATQLKSRAERGDTWQIIKHQGRPYLRGYLPTPMSAEAMRQGHVWLISRAKPGLKFSRYFVMEQPSAVTLPLDGLESLPNDSVMTSDFLAEEFDGIRPDSYLFESWTDPLSKTPLKK